MRTFKAFFSKIIVLVAAGLLIASCSKNNDTEPTNNNTPNNPPASKPLWPDTLARKWVVTNATHNTQNDPGSVGLEFVFKKDGTYVFEGGQFNGTWKFADSTYKMILLDETHATLKTMWTATVFTSKKMSVDFKSPFTGGKAHWDFEAK